MILKNKYLIVCIEFKCNNSCISCMIKDLKFSLKPVSFSLYKEILDKNFLTKKYDSLILSGAEITLNENLVKYVKYAKKIGNIQHIQIQTNARRFSNPKYCEKVVKSGVDEFFISVYGPNPKVHDKITRVKGSFSETIKGIENLGKFDVSVITNTVITKKNYKYLSETVSVLSLLHNIKEMQFWNYWPMSENDDYNLLESNIRIKPFLLKAIKKCSENKISVIIKNFPECLLDKYSNVLDNSQPDIIVDPKLWRTYNLNQFGQCIFSRQCLNKKCSGLTTAYIKKFGWEKDTIKPIINSTN